MSKFDWKRLRDCMLKYDQETAPECVHEVMEEIIKKEDFNLNELDIKEIKEIIDIGINTLINFYGRDFENFAYFDYILNVGLVRKLYMKYPEVRERWYDEIWFWRDNDWED